MFTLTVSELLIYLISMNYTFSKLCDADQAHAFLAFTLRGQLKLLKFIPDNFLDFRACVAMDGAVRATQDAKAEMRIEIGSVNTGIYREISN